MNHFNIESRESYGYLLYEKYFKTVGELVEYYRTNDIPNREHIKHIRLTNPIYSTRVTKEERRPSIGLSESQSSGEWIKANFINSLPEHTPTPPSRQADLSWEIVPWQGNWNSPLVLQRVKDYSRHRLTQHLIVWTVRLIRTISLDNLHWLTPHMLKWYLNLADRLIRTKVTPPYFCPN